MKLFKKIILLLLLLFSTNLYADVNVLNYKAIPNDSKDDTIAIQNAVNATPINANTIIPNGIYYVNGNTPIKLKSYTNLKLAPKTILKLIPNNLKSASVLLLNNIKHVNISGGTIEGDRYLHKNTLNSFSSLITLTNTAYVNINNISLNYSWEDGVYLGGLNNSYIILDNIISSQNRRTSLYVNSGNHINAKNSHFVANITSGIILQSNSGNISNVTIKNNYCTYNSNFGIFISNTTKFNVKSISIDSNVIYKSNLNSNVFVNGGSAITIVNNKLGHSPTGVWLSNNLNSVIANNYFYYDYYGIKFTNFSFTNSAVNNVFDNVSIPIS